MANRSQFSENYFKGVQQAEQEHAAQRQRENDDQDREHKKILLKHQIDKLKMEGEIAARDLDIQNYTLQQGERAPEANFPAQGESPVGALPGQTQPLIPQHQAAVPLPKMPIRGLPGNEEQAPVPGIEVQPQSMQDIFTQRRQEAMQKQTDALNTLQQAEAIKMPGRTAAAEINANAANDRLAQQQDFTGKQNELNRTATATNAANSQNAAATQGAANREAAMKRAQLTASTSLKAASLRAAATNRVRPLSAEAAKVYGNVKTIVPEINSIKEAFGLNLSTGQVDEARYRQALTGFVAGTDRKLVKLVDQVADKVGRLRSGGAINKDEENRFKAQIASFKDLLFADGDNAIDALDGILNEANTVMEAITVGPNQGGGTTAPGQPEFDFVPGKGLVPRQKP